MDSICIAWRFLTKLELVRIVIASSVEFEGIQHFAKRLCKTLHEMLRVDPLFLGREMLFWNWIDLGNLWTKSVLGSSLPLICL